MNNREQINAELYQRDGLIYVVAIACVFLVGFAYKYSYQFPFLSLLALFLALGGGFWTVSTLYAYFQQRDRIIKFKQNINPLFVHSEWPGNLSGDTGVLGARDYAIESLLLARAEHVKVYTIFYQDPVYTVHWWEFPEGKNPQLKFDMREREGVVVNETWENFLIFLDDLKTKKTDQNLRDIYRRNKSSEGVEAVQRFVHQQQ